MGLRGDNTSGLLLLLLRFSRCCALETIATRLSVAAAAALLAAEDKSEAWCDPSRRWSLIVVTLDWLLPMLLTAVAAPPAAVTAATMAETLPELPLLLETPRGSTPRPRC
jgi:hypothetical protein